MEGNALEALPTILFPVITQLLFLMLFCRSNMNLMCLWCLLHLGYHAVQAVPEHHPDSIKKQFSSFVSGDKHKLLNFTTAAAERWVKKNRSFCFIVHTLNPALTTLLHFWQQRPVDTCCILHRQTSNTEGFFFLFMSRSNWLF